jgi:hypothetical protein
MKKLFTLFIALSLFSCSDGDFDTPEFEFTDNIKSCDEFVLYVTNSNTTETLVLTLVAGELGTTVGEKSFAISTTRKVVYRLFDKGISTNYFCQVIPPTTPKVLKELNVESGNVIITTSEVYKNQVLSGYSYKISFSDLLFIDGNERIFYQTFPFGTFPINL